MKIRGKILLRIFGVILLLFVLLNFDLIRYGLFQATGQARILLGAVPVSVYLSRPDIDRVVKDNLILVEEIRQFAFDSLGLSYSDNYTTVYDQEGKELLWVVNACQPFQLKAKVWKFPLIGSFSYKGFFDKRKAIKLKEELEKQGYDTSVRSVGGWSTLGWFKDPVLTGMLQHEAGDLAEVIIHELTHGTLFVKDSLKFNENLASFFGEKGSELFLSYRFGENSILLTNYKKKLADEKLLSAHILKGADFLDSLYTQMDDKMPVSEKRLLKHDAIKQIIFFADTLSLNNKERYLKWLHNLNPNNTLFMSYLRYRGDLRLLKKDLQDKYNGETRLMIEDYMKTYGSL